ncbi:butyrophilin-like protein 1-like protein [Anopheles sinensis]|uniref:Butyrophilin-like protein 1-like protein n=1 Tax=Anopheles sinensis TaxID=74873 RepID=A0A084WUE0_ANOSI|nr:butyrophilin-like protein 1-like protein [Anopheles sinensis]
MRQQQLQNQHRQLPPDLTEGKICTFCLRHNTFGAHRTMVLPACLLVGCLPKPTTQKRGRANARMNSANPAAST